MAVVVVGTQWGDEGKGKITDYLARDADIIVRYQGGANAGHTITVGKEVYKLHTIPSGVLYPGKTCVIGSGVVVDPQILVEEMEGLAKRGISLQGLKISDRAHLIMPYHRRLDELEEKRRGTGQIGTTLKGIGPAYADKIARRGIRVADLLDEESFHARLAGALEQKNEILEKVYGVKGFSLSRILAVYQEYASHIKPLVVDASFLLNEALSRGQKLLLEGAQGTMLDLDHGTYPYVTSSNPVSGGAAVGSGLGPGAITSVVGVAKAYSTRVGDGPFPTEMQSATAGHIREIGREYGTTTGRPRRIGWLDAVILNHAARVNGLQYLALTLLDVLTGIDPIKICTGYVLHGKPIHHVPANLRLLEECRPRFVQLPGWEEDLSQIERFRDFPPQAKQYIQQVEDLCGVPVALVSVGPRRSQTKVLREISPLTKRP